MLAHEASVVKHVALHQNARVRPDRNTLPTKELRMYPVGKFWSCPGLGNRILFVYEANTVLFRHGNRSMIRPERVG